MRHITKKNILALFKFIALFVILGLILYIVLLYFGYKNHQKEFYEEVYSHFDEIYVYVLENKEVYKEFSEYQISLLNDDNICFNVEREGNMQEMRDIVFEPFDLITAGIDSSGEANIRFYLHMPSYEISCYYCPNGIKMHESNQSKVIDDCIWISFSRTAY